MKHVKAINTKAQRIERQALARQDDVMALQSESPHVPMGCVLSFFPGWEVDSSGGTAGLCQPVERDIFDCYVMCFWPTSVPDHMHTAPDWTSKCATATKDWRNIDIVFP
jgi:hypothetical protein